MGIFSSFKEWRKAQYEKYVSDMEAKGLCPDCRGRGFDLYPVEYYFTTNPPTCAGCNGSGAFADWKTHTTL